MNTIPTVLEAAPGTALTLKPDYFVLTDGTAKTVPSLLGDRALPDASKVKVFIDHETPCGSEAHAEWQKQLIRFATERGCELFNGYGTSYQLMLEKVVKPGQVVAHCGDYGSVYGACGVLAVKLSPEELAEAVLRGEVSMSAPEKLHLRLEGALKAPACAKDAAIAALGLLGDTKGKLVLVSGDVPEGSEKLAFFQLLSLSGCDAALEEEKRENPDAVLKLDEVVPMVAGPNDFTLTVPAAELKEIPETGSPLIGDMSSDILSCERDYSKFTMFYAGAQKNLGPSGMAVVAIRKEFAERGDAALTTMLQYRTFVNENSLFNTPPTWGIYIYGETMKWVKKMGKENLFKLNAEKAKKIYDVIDSTEFYRGTAKKEFRSNMNVTWRLPTEELEAQFIAEAKKLGMGSLKGHRSVGGIRASIYNAFPMEGVDALVAFMKDFEKKNG